jgi:type I restriction enzyme R subunit
VKRISLSQTSVAVAGPGAEGAAAICTTALVCPTAAGDTLWQRVPGDTRTLSRGGGPRALWSAPDTRKKLLQGLAEKGFGGEQLAEMQKIIDAEKSDLFDVLAHVAYALPPVTREERAARAKLDIDATFNRKQQVFLDFVLSHYVSVGVEELDQDKLTPLLRLKYHNSIADALADLGRAEEIGRVFAGFQKYLYQQQAAA